MSDYYEILEVHPNASPEVIARVYRVLVSRYHPDLHPPERRAWAEERMKRINEAFSVLSDPQKRADYDRKRQAANRSDGNAAGAAASPAPPPNATAPSVAVVDAAVCVFHPLRPRISICLKCRRSVCEACRVLRDGRPYCRECAQRLIEPVASPSVTPTAPMRRVRDAPPKPRWRLSGWAWVNTSLAACALAAWLYVIVAPRLVHDRASAVLVSALCGVLAAGIVFSMLIAWRSQQLPLRGVGASAARLVAALLLLILLWTGAQRAMQASAQVQRNIAYREAEHIRRAKEEEEKGYLRKFIASFPGHEEPKKGVSQRIGEGLSQWIEKHTGGTDDERTPLDAGRVEPLFNQLPLQNINAARDWAKKFVGTEYSKRLDQTHNRAVCLHFIVWAELKQPSGADVTKEAEECLQLTRREGLAQRGERKGNCDFYLVLRRIQRGDRQAVQQGLSFVNRHIQSQFPEALDQLVGHLLSFFRDRHDWQSLLTLQRHYAAVFPTNNPAMQQSSGPRAVEIEQAVRQAFRWQVGFVHQLIREDSPRAKDEGLEVLRQELSQRDPEAFEGLALELGQWLYQRRDKNGLQQLQSQYQTVSQFKRHQTQFDQWLGELGTSLPSAKPAATR